MLYICWRRTKIFILDYIVTFDVAIEYEIIHF